MLPFRVAGPEADDRLRLVVRERDRADGLEGVAGVLVAGEVPADERDQRDRRREGERRADTAPGQAGRLTLRCGAGASSVGHLFELGWQLGRRAGLDQHLVHALEALVLSGREALSDQVLELG